MHSFSLSMITWSHTLGQNIMAAGMCGEASSWKTGNREKRAYRRGQGETQLTKTHFLQLGSISTVSSTPKSLFRFEFINEKNYLLDQSPRGSVISGTYPTPYIRHIQRCVLIA